MLNLATTQVELVDVRLSNLRQEGKGKYWMSLVCDIKRNKARKCYSKTNLAPL